MQGADILLWQVVHTAVIVIQNVKLYFMGIGLAVVPGQAIDVSSAIQAQWTKLVVVEMPVPVPEQNVPISKCFLLIS